MLAWPRLAARASGLSRALGARCMSRVGKLPVGIPKDVKVTLDLEPPPQGTLAHFPVNDRLWRIRPRPSPHDFGDCQVVTVEGARGKLRTKFHSVVRVRSDGSQLHVAPVCGGTTVCGRTMWGTTRALLANMVRGVTKGFKRELELQGVGFRASLSGDELVLKIGFSHDVRYAVPARYAGQVAFEVPQPTSVVVSGASKEAVHEVAAQVRRLRPPEPYKGKGIRYAGEEVRLRPGKKK